ncbi:hypothetical protein CM19_13070 [Candidatus Acidianus copahuensis]|uniref:HD domain-containing protein n=1 Tax=Candidatus Acidianus copahuensis TaxID=1160895 RepID=A0A031LKW9_9CREN|nr:HD domain-containing protein [Candidatus Acidianus copahuensis]EZQ01543.1 hypothetical protein CM19_13070 [Candidatus Acidianus copahuensis]
MSQKNKYCIRLDPLTLSFKRTEQGSNVSNQIESFLKEVKEEALKKIDEKLKARCNENVESCGELLNTFADVLVSKINEAWEEYYRNLTGFEGKINPFITVPADTRFPGIVNSLADHMVTTSAFAVSAILAIYDKKYKETGFTCRFKDIEVKFNDREFLRGFVRVAALLHDIGKPPPQGHTKRTYDIVYNLFKNINETLARTLASASSRHHYGKSYDKDSTPSNDIEWVIAYADKASASSRGFTIREKDIYVKLIGFVKELDKWGYEIGNGEDLDLLKRMVEGKTVNLSEDEDYQQFRTYGVFSSDENRAIELASELIKAENRLMAKDDKLLAVFHFEIPSIKSYLNRGRELAVYAGYSMMIDSIVHEVSKRLRDEVGEEVVISDEGGSVLAIVPSTLDVNKILEGIEEMRYFAIKYGLFAFYFAEAHLGPKDNWTGWNGYSPYERDTYRGFGALIMKAFSEFDKENIKLPPTSKEEVEIDKLCKACRVNKRKDGSDYCEACDLAREYYKAFRSLVMGEKTEGKIAKKLKRLRIFKLTREIIKDIVLPETLDHLNRKCINKNNYVADETDLDERRYPVLMVADGDNFGSIKSSASTLVQYLEITRFFTWIIYTGVLYAVTKSVGAIGDEMCVEFYPILLGGDDFSVLTTSQVLPIFVYYLDEALRNIGGWLKKSELLEKLSYGEGEDIAEKVRIPKPYQLFTFSAGAYIMNSTSFPLFLAREEAELLEGVSKKYSKSNLYNDYYGSGVILTIADSKTIAPDDEVLLDRASKGMKLKAMPLLGSKIKDLLCDVVKLERSEVKYGELRTFVKIGNSRLEITYNLVRNKRDSFETVASILLSNKEYNLQDYYLLLTIMMDTLEQKINNKYYWEVYNDKVLKCPDSRKGELNE